MKYLINPLFRFLWAALYSGLLLTVSLIAFIALGTWHGNLKIWSKHFSIFNPQIWRMEVESLWTSNRFIYTSPWHYLFGYPPVAKRFTRFGEEEILEMIDRKLKN
jgi:hypothetical protein